MSEKEKILELIQNSKNNSITFRKLQKKLTIDPNELKNLLQELKLDAKILQLSDKYYIFPDDLLIGDISQTASGKKVIFHDDEKVPVAANFLNAAILNDIVSFKINEFNEAEIVSIVDRRTTNVTCRIKIDSNGLQIIPYRKGLQISLDKEDKKNLADGDIILVDISNYDDNFCNAKLIKKLAIKDNPHAIEIETAINYGFSNDFSDEYLEEIAKIPTDTTGEDLSNRTDLRALKTFTIDPINAGDMDDACSVEKINDDIIRVYIHISDVSHYVSVGSELYNRAKERQTSLYMNDINFPLFHYILSNGICSLKEKSDRLTKTAIFDVDKFGKISNFKIVKSIINSDKKMNYDDADKVLLGNTPLGYEDYQEELLLLKDASARIQNRMTKNGSLLFANTTIKKVEQDGKEICKEETSDSPSGDLIEFLMIETNHQISSYLLRLGIPSIFRIHEFPDIERVNECIKTLKDLGKRLHLLRSLDSPFDIQQIQKKLMSDDDYQIISNLILRNLKRARYSTENLGHFALALYSYTHFTAPIRRFIDLVIHTILDFAIEDREYVNIINKDTMEKKLDLICEKANLMTKQADMAEKESDRNLILASMKDFIGEEFDAFVIDITNKIKIRINGIDVYIDETSLSQDFKYNKSRKAFYDTTNNTYLKPARKIRVLLNNIDLTERTISLTVLNIVNEKTLTKKVPN